MDQVEEGQAPFDGLPTSVTDVQIFQHMPNALVSCGKIVKNNHKIILDDPIATVINKDTNKLVMEAVFDNRTNTRNIYPNGPVPYKFKKEQEVDSLGFRSTTTTTSTRSVCHPSCQQCILIDNTERNSLILSCCRRMACKKDVDCSNSKKCVCIMAWTRRIHGLTTSRSKRPTALGHMNARRLVTQSTKKKKKEKDGEEKMNCILDEENNSRWL